MWSITLSSAPWWLPMVAEMHMSLGAECPVCGNHGEAFRTIGAYALVRCPVAACRHVWVADGPDEAELNKHYDTDESLFENANAFQVLADYQANPEAVRQYYYRDRTRHLESRVGDVMSTAGASILDVGCSSGAFLATLRDRGFSVHGQDVAIQAVAKGREVLGLDLHAGVLAEYGLERPVDLATCYDVIEHCIDPAALLSEIRSRLVAGGRLVVRTPNHSGWLLRLTGPKWLWYIPPAHQHYFNPGSLAALLRRSGFVVESTRTDVGTYLYLLRHYLLPATGTASVSLDMPAWRANAVRALDGAVRIGAWPLLAWASRAHQNPVLEVYARAVES